MTPIPKYLNTKSPQHRGRKWEKHLIQTINSGAIWFDKGNGTESSTHVKIGETKHLIEIKRPSRKSYVLTYQTLEKGLNDASDMNKEPLIIICIKDLMLVGTIVRIRTRKEDK